jgi:hypothetical protein
MGNKDYSPRLSTDPATELAALIARELELHEEGLTITRRIRELHEQISQQARDSEGEMHPERRAQGDR